MQELKERSEHVFKAAHKIPDMKPVLVGGEPGGPRPRLSFPARVMKT